MLRDEIKPYIDRYGLVTPGPDNGVTGNGTMYTAEYYILLDSLGELKVHIDPANFMEVIFKCQRNGLTLRSQEDFTLDSPDNLLGILAGCEVLAEYEDPRYGQTRKLANTIYSYGKKHFGFYDPTGTNGLKAFMFRQLQVVFAMICASGRYSSFNPIHGLLNAYTALIIATSGMHATKDSGSDGWRLAYLLIHCVSKHSWLCRQAAKLWVKRLLKLHPNGMLDVYKEYYNPKGIHPFTKYMVKY